MRILSRVAIQFKHPSDRRLNYTINPSQKLLLLDAPDWLADCPLFNWAVNDGSIDVVYTKQKQVELENEPVQNALPTGKTVEDFDPQEASIPSVSVVQAAQEEQMIEAPKPKTRRKSTKQ